MVRPPQALAACCCLLAVDPAAASPAVPGDATALLQLGLGAVEDKPKAKKTTSRSWQDSEMLTHLYRMGNDTKEDDNLKSLVRMAEAMWGKGKAEREHTRVRGMEVLTDEEYDMMLYQPWMQRAMRTLHVPSPERVYELLMPLRSIMENTAQGIRNKVSTEQVKETQAKKEWQDKFSTTPKAPEPLIAVPTIRPVRERQPLLRPQPMGMPPPQPGPWASAVPPPQPVGLPLGPPARPAEAPAFQGPPSAQQQQQQQWQQQQWQQQQWQQPPLPVWGPPAQSMQAMQALPPMQPMQPMQPPQPMQYGPPAGPAQLGPAMQPQQGMAAWNPAPPMAQR